MFASQFKRPVQTVRPFNAVVGALALIFSLACPGLGAQADAVLEDCADGAALQRAVVRLNALREQAELPCASVGTALQPLAWEARLAGSAYAQAQDLAARELLSHVDSRQQGLGARLRSAGYVAAGAGENLAVGHADFNGTLQAWLASPQHCANLMQANFRDVGLACVQRRGVDQDRFWVAHLGAPARR